MREIDLGFPEVLLNQSYESSLPITSLADRNLENEYPHKLP
jgi:hypothetical protein